MDLLWLIPAFPLLGFVILFATQGRLGELPASLIGAGSMGLSALAAAFVGYEFVSSGETVFTQTLWSWMQVGGFNPSFTLYLDGLSLVMMGVITGVGFLIHVYATGYMKGEDGFSRFFSYMNLFVFAMLMLVLGDNLLVLYLGWEGVGLCSYLLIGFYHHDPANGYAARKAFVVTRVGDTAMALGMFLLFKELGTMDIQAALSGAQATWPEGSPVVTAIALLLLGGAVGKSAQLPLQTWLPDAMAGPTPVSALIHAATMVTAGVYLIARTHDLFLLSSTAQLMVASIGLATLFISAFTALTQTDLKRILAYSTMSQIGYMFFALGVGAWSAAIFHLMTHAFFKALLFLAAGSVILALHHEQDIFKMGGLWRRLRIPFVSMLIGSAALAALPLTSGYYSKDLILLKSWSFNPLFWAGASVAALLTALYSVRMISIVFFGEMRTEPHEHKAWNLSLPLIVLSVLALAGGWFGLAPLAAVLPDGGIDHDPYAAWLVWGTASIPIIGVVLGFFIFYPPAKSHERNLSAGVKSLQGFLFSGWGFDTLYRTLIERPFNAIAHWNRNDIVDSLFTLIVTIATWTSNLIARSQTGQLRWYAANMVIGTVIVLMIAVVVS
ncbi:MAG: NADH-quinone oxidoreductase subunit L [Proteobacteria bacterium]|nr:NADH-quinone oxidoreductase subunit L [Pseudomonadota bacterium]